MQTFSTILSSGFQLKLWIWDTQYLFFFIQEHYRECKKYQVECPHGCGAKMQQEKVDFDISLNGCFNHFLKNMFLVFHCFCHMFSKLMSVLPVSVMLLMMNFVMTLSKYLWIHEAIMEWIHTLLWQCYEEIHWHQFVFYDNKLSSCLLSLVDASHKL